MKQSIRAAGEGGFSMVELMVSLLILLPIMGAAVSLFSVTVGQHSAEESSSQATQDARTGLELMVRELSQAGSHREISTRTTSALTGDSTTAQPVNVTSIVGINVGDWIQIGTDVTTPIDDPVEEVEVTAVGTGTITGIFRKSRVGNDPVRLFGLPYTSGVVRPAGLGANSSATVTTLRFFGDISGAADSTYGTTDPNCLYYVVYSYNSSTGQITRSMTPATQGSLSAALPIISNIRPNSAQFTLYTNDAGVVTSVRISLVVQNTVRSGDRLQETALSTRVVMPSMVTAGNLLSEILDHGVINHLPPTPANIASWATQ